MVEDLQLAGEVAGTAVGVDVLPVVVRAEAMKQAAGSATRYQAMTRMEWATATKARSLPRCRTRRWYLSRKKVLLLAAAGTASPSTPSR